MVLIVSIGVSSDRSQLRCTGFAGSHQKQSIGYQFNKCGIVMVANGNIYRGNQLIIDVIDYKMLKGKFLVGMLSAQPIRPHN